MQKLASLSRNTSSRSVGPRMQMRSISQVARPKMNLQNHHHQHVAGVPARTFSSMGMMRPTRVQTFRPTVAPIRTPQAATKASFALPRASFSTKVQSVKSFKPLYDRVLIKKDAPPEKTAGGLYLPDSQKNKVNFGKVISVGEGKRDVHNPSNLLPLSVKVGDMVMLSEWGGTTIKVEDEEHVVVREDEILGVVQV